MFGCDAFHHGLEAFFKIAAVLRAGDERPHIQLVDFGALQGLGHIAVLDALCQAIDNGRLAHTGFTDVKRIVLVLAAQYLNGAVQFRLAPDQRIVVGQVVVDAQHIIPPPAGCRAGFLLFVRLVRFTLIN